MGYSKYTEDIVDRWVEDTLDREAAFYRQWALDHVPAPPPPAGEIRIEVEGRRLEDEEVFPTGNLLKMRPVVSNGAAPPEIAVTRAGVRSALRPDAIGAYTLRVQKPECIEVEAASGPYHRFYTVHFVEIASIDRIEGLADEIGRFAANPPGWTREQFESFRMQLRRILAAHSVPQIFADGLIEYYLSVQLEADGNPLFAARLESAYVILKKFAAFSDVASLVTEYFRYRTNLFNSGQDTTMRPLGAIAAFYRNSAPVSSELRGTTRGVELVVPEVEYCCMEAARAMLRGDPTAALGQVSASRKLQGQLNDPRREERCAVIEGRAHVALGQTDKAKAAYQLLVNSTCPIFHDEASAFLRK